MMTWRSLWFHLGPIHSELSEVPYSTNQSVFWQGTFFLSTIFWNGSSTQFHADIIIEERWDLTVARFVSTGSFSQAQGRQIVIRFFLLPKKEYFKYLYISGDFLVLRFLKNVIE